MLSFEEPGWLILLAVVPILIYLRHFSKGTRNYLPEPFANWRGSFFVVSGRWYAWLQTAGAVLSYVGLTLLIVAIARPVAVTQRPVYLTHGSDIVIALDVSPSMSARDLGADNRFETAIAVIDRFLATRKNEAVGIVAFGRDAALIVPPTPDYRTVEKRLREIKVAQYGDGTAIGMGLAVACLHLRDSTAPRKSIILLTDGENNSGEISPETASDIALGLGIPIYVIGVGTRGEVPLEYVDPQSGKRYSGMYRSDFDEGALRDIAERTGGRYFSVQSADALVQVFSRLGEEQSAEVRVRTMLTTRQLYEAFLALGLVASSLGFALETIFLGALP
jgi:Ca-activated chloride channel homolog